MPDDADREVLKRFVRGDMGAFETLFRQFEGEVYRWVLRIVRDGAAADDVLVESFWRAYRARARFDSSRSFGAWMRRIATNAARDELRKRRNVVDLEIPAKAGSDRDVEEAVAVAFGKLPPRLRVAATLALIEEQPYAEIA